MTKRAAKSLKTVVALPADYGPLLAAIKARVQTSRIKAALAANHEHHIALLDKLEHAAHRLWYAAKAVEHGWSRNVLALQIEAGLHEREGKAVTNFKRTLPPARSDLAQGITKDPYLFDFLALREDASERAVVSIDEAYRKLCNEGGGRGYRARSSRKRCFLSASLLQLRPSTAGNCHGL